MRTTQSEQPHQASYAPVMESEPIELDNISADQITYKSYGRTFGFRYSEQQEVFKPYLIDDPDCEVIGTRQYGSAKAILNDLLKAKSAQLIVFINGKQI